MAAQGPKARRRGGADAAASEYQPQLATLVEAPPVGPGWLHELKYDGYRMGCLVRGGRIRLFSRRGNEWTESFPEVIQAVRALPCKQALLDGEVVILLPDGRTSFQALQNARSGGTRAGLVYFAFDLLELDRRDLRALPLEQRKAALEQLIAAAAGQDVVRYSQHFARDGRRVFAHACRLGAEGIVAKRAAEPHRVGRGRGWLKVKCVLRQDLVIGGFTDPRGARQGIGALLVGYHDDGGALRFAGKVGTGAGFTLPFLRELRTRLQRIEQRECPFTPRPAGPLGRSAHYVRPELVAEVAFGEWTADGRVRHASLQGLRPDMNAKDVRRELPSAIDAH